VTREIALLVNPTSGKGKGARLAEPVAERLRSLGASVDVVVGRDADEALDKLRDRVASLTRDELTLRLPVLYVVGRAPG